jgi:hypothetical protein
VKEFMPNWWVSEAESQLGKNQLPNVRYAPEISHAAEMMLSGRL